MDNDKPIGAPHLSDTPETPPANQPESVQQVKKKLNWKGFFIAIVAVVLIEVVAVNMLHMGEPKITKPQSLQPTSKPTTKISKIANWKTFTSSHFPFTMQYPPQFAISDDNGTGNQGMESRIIAYKQEQPDRTRGTLHGYCAINLYPNSINFKKTAEDFTARRSILKYTYSHNFQERTYTFNENKIHVMSGDRFESKKGKYAEWLIENKNGMAIIVTYTGNDNYLSEATIQRAIDTVTFTGLFPTVAPLPTSANPTPNPTQYYLQTQKK